MSSNNLVSPFLIVTQPCDRWRWHWFRHATCGCRCDRPRHPGLLATCRRPNRRYVLRHPRYIRRRRYPVGGSRLGAMWHRRSDGRYMRHSAHRRLRFVVGVGGDDERCGGRCGARPNSCGGGGFGQQRRLWLGDTHGGMKQCWRRNDGGLHGSASANANASGGVGKHCTCLICAKCRLWTRERAHVTFRHPISVFSICRRPLQRMPHHPVRLRASARASCSGVVTAVAVGVCGGQWLRTCIVACRLRLLVEGHNRRRARAHARA